MSQVAGTMVMVGCGDDVCVWWEGEVCNITFDTFIRGLLGAGAS